MPFVPGQRIRASDLNRLGQLVARNSRTTNITTTATTQAAATRALSTIATVTAGRSYRVRFRTNLQHTVASVSGLLDLYYTTDGTEPVVVTSSLLTQGRLMLSAANTLLTVEITGTFDAATGGQFRAMVAIRASAAGTLTLAAAASNPTELDLEDLGDTIASTGTVY